MIELYRALKLEHIASATMLFGTGRRSWCCRSVSATLPSARHNEALPPAYGAIMRWWLAPGWPAFLALISIFALMVTKPTLW